jgi:hypothetical protein
MGLDFSYLLYFNREHLWEALQGVAAIAVPHHTPTVIHFPDHELSIPLNSWVLKDRRVHHDDPEYSFATSLIFEEDEAIEDYFFGLGIEYTYRGPPGTDEGNRISIGYIYLTVYNDLSWLYPQGKPTGDLVLFDFGTTGTRMSLLFDDSTSIRKTFVKLLEKYRGVCGVFNRESGGGELFWFKGRFLSEYIGDAYMMPAEIEGMLNRQGLVGNNDREVWEEEQ